MSEFYDIDSSRVTHREYWWGSPTPLVLIGWIIIDYRNQTQRLRELERSGVTRRSGRSAVDTP